MTPITHIDDLRRLAYGTDARTALNLQSNPGNLGKKVSIEGTLEKYFGVGESAKFAN